jgi:hypothetical protein
MNALTKRFIFCFCGGASGAALSLQFASESSVLIIAAIMSAVGWVMADIDAFVVGLKGFINIQTQKFLDVWNERVHGKNAIPYHAVTLLLVSYVCGFALLQAGFILEFSSPLLFEDTVRDSFGQKMKVLVSLILSVFVTVGFLSVCFESGKSLWNNDRKALWQVAGWINPIRWIPVFISVMIELTYVIFWKSLVQELFIGFLRFIHTQERLVYAFCFTLGTLGGFWVGKHLGIPAGAFAGGIVSFAIAWLDWKFLSVRLGWRTA